MYFKWWGGRERNIWMNKICTFKDAKYFYTYNMRTQTAASCQFSRVIKYDLHKPRLLSLLPVSPPHQPPLLLQPVWCSSWSLPQPSSALLHHCSWSSSLMLINVSAQAQCWKDAVKLLWQKCKLLCKMLYLTIIRYSKYALQLCSILFLFDWIVIIAYLRRMKITLLNNLFFKFSYFSSNRSNNSGKRLHLMVLNDNEILIISWSSLCRHPVVKIGTVWPQLKISTRFFFFH